MINDGDRKVIDQCVVFNRSSFYGTLFSNSRVLRKKRKLFVRLYVVNDMVSSRGSASLMVKVVPPSFIFLSSVLRVIQILLGKCRTMAKVMCLLTGSLPMSQKVSETQNRQFS